MLSLEIPDVLSVAFRAISFVLLLSAAGTPVFIALFRDLLSNSAATIVRLGRKFAVAALVFVIGHQSLEGARMTGDMSGVMDPQMQMMGLSSSAGAAFGLKVAGLVLILVALTRGARADSRRAAGVGIGLSGTVIAIVAFSATGHTSVAPNRWLAAAFLILHLLTVSFWIGALWPLYVAATRERPAQAARLIDAFSRQAGWLVPIILLAGVGLAAILLQDLSVLRRAYGQLLLTKLALFTLLMALAAANKWRFGPACAQGDTRGFKRTVVVEYAVICAVLAVTAAMTTFYSPEEP